MGSQAESREVMWKAIDAIAKLLGAGIITAAITIYGIKTDQARQAALESTRQVQTLVEITNRQKDLDLNLGMRLFETLMNHYFQKERSTDSVQERLLLLRLMALNFQDVPLNFKPLFEQLATQATDGQIREEVRDIARDVARRQALRLTLRNGLDSGIKTVKAGDTVLYPNLQFGFQVAQVSPEAVKVHPLIEGQTLAPFVVSYFDTPIIDNIKLGPKRVALLLLGSTGQEAQMRLIAFESDLATDRFDIRELSRELSQNVFQ
ncbi:MAG: hypothetical protein AB7N91_28100 [Candidatus Tectimicrobiota bacterium]